MWSRLRTYASFVRFSHSVFALPFALVGALLAARTVGFEWRRVIWIVGCMVAARSAAMGFNRLVDARFDARNPRTASRELPAGRMSTTEARLFIVVSVLVFLVCAFQLGMVCFLLAPVALAIVVDTPTPCPPCGAGPRSLSTRRGSALCSWNLRERFC